MTWFKNRSIGSKLVTAFLVVIGLGAAVGVFAITQLSGIDADVDVLTKEALPGITRVSALSDSVAQARRHVLGALLATTTDERASYIQKAEVDSAAFVTRLAAYSATV